MFSPSQSENHGVTGFPCSEKEKEKKKKTKEQPKGCQSFFLDKYDQSTSYVSMCYPSAAGSGICFVRLRKAEGDSTGEAEKGARRVALEMGVVWLWLMFGCPFDWFGQK